MISDFNVTKKDGVIEEIMHFAPAIYVLDSGISMPPMRANNVNEKAQVIST